MDRFNNTLIENREIRIFLSSTFSDMDSERSALVKLFNKLKLEANRRNVSLSLLDLRWGVTDEESRTGKVLSVCLNEIENSHPFFIGLLGSRYGYSPKASELEKNPDLKERYPWLPQDIAQGLSITEIEMQYGVLRNQEGVDAAFFIKNTPDTLPDDDSKLSTLKKEILDQKRFPVTDYTSIDNLCDKVEQVVMDLLDKYFSNADNTRLGRERNIQRAYMNSRHKFYIRRQEDFDRLNEFANNDESHLVVTGKSGMGKSSLLANWVKEQENKKDLPYNIIYHFVGNTYGGNGYEEILQHISDELFDLYEGLEVILGNYESPEQKAQRYMIEAVQKGKPMIIVIDGINQIRDYNNAKLLNWLPQSVQKVKYLYSTLQDDETMETFHRRKYPIYMVEPLDEKQRQDFIVEYLEKVGKHLNPSQLTRILKDPENENTLVLKTLLDELICFGSYEHLDERIDYYLSAPSIPDFFERMLQRMEEDYTDVKRILSLIAVSEHGLSEDEIIAITGIRQMDFHMFYCAFSEHLVTRDGLLNFAHQYISDAVWNRYNLKELEPSKYYRKDIIRYFSITEIADYNRKTFELAFQYYHIDEYENLFQTILPLKTFNIFNKTEKDKSLLALYWRKLIDYSPNKYHLNSYLKLTYDNFHINDIPYLEMGIFIQQYFSDNYTCIEYYQAFIRLSSNAKDTNILKLSASYINLGEAYCSLGNYQKALDCLHECLSLCHTHYNDISPELATCYGTIGRCYNDMGYYDVAIKYTTKCLRLCKSYFGESDLCTITTYHNMGLIYKTQNDYKNALYYYFKALTLRQNILGIEAIDNATSYDNISVIYIIIDDLSEALKFAINAMSLYEKLLGTFHLDTATSYNNIGSILLKKEKISDAILFFSKSLEIRKKLLPKYHVDIAQSLTNLGICHRKSMNYQSALKYALEALEVNQNCLDFNKEHPLIALSYNNLGAVYYSMEQYSEALKYYRLALELEKKRGHLHNDYAISHMNIGHVYRSLKQYDMAIDNYLKALKVFQYNLGIMHRNTLMANKDIADTYKEQKKYFSALEYYYNTLSICQLKYGENHNNTKEIQKCIDSLLYYINSSQFI